MFQRVLLSLSVLLFACNEGDFFQDQTEIFFDNNVLHEVEITVEPEFVALLDSDNEERVPAIISFDGVVREEIGIRLKGFIGSVQSIDEKPGFSIKLNEFVKGQRLFGLKKFTLNNAVQDPSFVSEHVGYEIWRRAGIPARRTAHARVTFNGEYFGVYVVAEAVNDNFLARNFPDGSGNVYEGTFRVDVIDIDDIDLDTNQLENDRSDLLALQEVILEVPDEQFLEELSKLVDLDAFFSYWAVELLTYHWDGYAEFPSPFSNNCCSPNNYFVYHEPARDKIIFMPHGADQLFQNVSFPIFVDPSSRASLAVRLFALEEAKTLLADKIREVLAGPWDTVILEERIDETIALIEDSVVEFDRNPRFDLEKFAARLEQVREFLRERPEIVLEELDEAGF